jgi:hypothetical protein
MNLHERQGRLVETAEQSSWEPGDKVVSQVPGTNVEKERNKRYKLKMFRRVSLYDIIILMCLVLHCWTVNIKTAESLFQKR